MASSNTSLTAVFNLVDNMSSKLDSIASRGEASVQSWEQMGEAADGALDSGASAADGIASSVDGYSTSLSRATASTDDWGNALDSGAASLDDMEGATEQAATASGQLDGALDSAADGMEELGRATEETTEETEELGEQSEDTGNQMSDAVNVMSSALAAAGITQLVKEITESLLEAAAAAAETETAFAKLETIAGSSSMDTLESEIAAVSSEMGIAQDELSDTVYNAISAGSAVEDAVDTAAAAAQLATAGFTDTSSALSVLSTAMNSYGDSAGTATEIADSLIMVQNLGVTTVADLSSAMGKAIATASAYSVDLGNIESAYVSMTKAGIATLEATTYLSSMMNELGDTGSDISSVISEETGSSFAELMDAGYSLADVLGIVYESLGEDSTAMMNLWGSAEAGKAANAIINQGLEEFNTNLETITGSAGATQTAYETMADTTEYSQQVMETAMENLTISIGSLLTPALSKLYDIAAKAFSWMTDIVTEHPAVAKVLTAVVVGLGSVAAALAGVAAASAAASIAATALGEAISVALGPIALIATAVTGVTAAVLLLADAQSEAYDDTMSMTAVTAEQYDELSDLEAQYEEACNTYGATSDEASKLKYQIDDLSASIEENGQSVEELVSEVDTLITAHDELMDSYAETTASIEDEETSNLALIAKMEDLAAVSDGSSAAQEALKAIIDEVNASVEGLDLTYKDLTKNTEESVKAAKELAKAQAEEELETAKYEEYIDLLQQASEEEDELAKLEEEVAAAQDRATEAQDAYMDSASYGSLSSMWSDELAEVEATSDALTEAEDKLSELQGTYSETKDTIAELEDELGLTVDSAEDLVTSADDYESAAAAAYQSVQSEIEELCTAYQTAYNEAYESFVGQFDLFDEAEADMEATVDATQAALDSQLEYWQTYNDNLETLSGISYETLGITQEEYDALMTEVQDGSVEAAGLAQSMVDAIESGDSQAVADLATTLSAVYDAQIEAAETTADWQTDFSGQMQEYVDEMSGYIDELDLSTDAASAAKATIQSYVNQITSSGSSAVTAAQNIADKVSAALSSADGTITVKTSTTVEGNAVGTTDSAKTFIAGEEGPELVVDHEGSTVFPASETAQIINAVSNVQTYGTGSEVVYTQAAEDSGDSGSSDKTITLQINGGGSMQITGGQVDQEALLSFLYAYLKPVLLEIIQQEIYEEGDMAYGY